MTFISIFFWSCAVVYIIMNLLSFLTIDTDVEIEHEAMLFGFFSFRNLITFLLFFSFVLNFPPNNPNYLYLKATLFGLLCLAIQLMVVGFLNSLKDERETDLSGLIGMKAKVYLEVRPNETGQIEIEYLGHRVLNAISYSPTSVYSTGTYCVIKSFPLQGNYSTVEIDFV